MINPLTPNAEPAEEQRITENMYFPTGVYDKKKVKENFLIKSDLKKQEVAEQVMSWLK